MAANKVNARNFAELFEPFFWESIPAIKKEEFNLLLIDQALIIGRSIADAVKLPFVTICCAAFINPDWSVPSILSPFEYQTGPVSKLRNLWSYTYLRYASYMISAVVKCRKEAGLYIERFSLDVERLVNSPIATIVPMPRSLEFPRKDLSEHVHFVGTLAAPKARRLIQFPWNKLDERFIYASLGTTHNPKEILLQVAQACDRLGVQAVISLGGHKLELPFPESAIVVDYAPQLELLERASLCITHAGLNTTIEALSQGVPLLAIPITSDQPGVSARIKYAGVGDRVLLHELSVPLLAEQIEKILQDPTYKAKAVKMAEEIDRAGGVVRAADIIERAMATNQPVPYYWSTDPCTLLSSK